MASLGTVGKISDVLSLYLPPPSPPTRMNPEGNVAGMDSSRNSEVRMMCLTLSTHTVLGHKGLKSQGVKCMVCECKGVTTGNTVSSTMDVHRHIDSSVFNMLRIHINRLTLSRYCKRVFLAHVRSKYILLLACLLLERSLYGFLIRVRSTA